MLFKSKTLSDIKTGKVSLAFRRWKTLSVKAGSLVKTSVGLIEILSIAPVEESGISEQEAINAGFADVSELVGTLRAQLDGTIYRIGIRYHSEDPRISLRTGSLTDDGAYRSLHMKLARLDQYSKTGPWTWKVMETISHHPHLRAADLAVLTGFGKEWLKLNIRKLKNLGLTQSHEVGYSISPLGASFMEKEREKL